MKCKKIYRKIVLLSLTIIASLMTSCTDFLTIIPPDKIVHENFWQTKDDVNGMLATSYLKLTSTDAVTKAIIWGELRSDNLTYHHDHVKTDERYIVEFNITPENSYTKWSIYYEAINYANLVIEYAPLVPERDPDFSPGDLEVVLGEMYAMRALCHFYLLRTFRDIPMAMVPAVNDSELPEYKQVHPLEALDLIMKDLNMAENMVMPTGNYSDKRHNYGRITKNAVLAMKADVNLWRAAFTSCYNKTGDSNPLANADVQSYYTECINNCQTILDNIDELYKKNNPKGNPLEELPYHLISNVDEVAIETNSYSSNSYERIFIDRNSSESIFELQTYDEGLDGHSDGVTDVYGSTGNNKVEVPKEGLVGKYEKDDLRKYSYMGIPISNDIPAYIRVAKYLTKYSPVKFNESGPQFPSDRKEVAANWIVYRQTDVMLMMAEALVAQPSVNSEDIKQAFKLVNVINTRSRADTTDIINPLKEPIDAETALGLVLDERARELAFEGKRWYDLVRKALRENTTENIKFVADKLGTSANGVKNKMLSIDNLFLPIHVEELRFNKHLKQNPAYATDDSTIGAKK